MDSLEAAAPQPVTRSRVDAWRPWVALVLGAGVPYLFFGGHAEHHGGIDPGRLTAIRLLIAGAIYFVGIGGWLYCFMRFVSREPLRSLNLKPGWWLTDLRDGFLLAFANMWLTSYARSFIELLPGYHRNSVAFDMGAALSTGSPLMICAFMLYTWLVAAVIEEVLRTYCITRILKFGQSTSLKLVAVFVSTILFATYHLYYGIYGAATLSVTGFLFAGYYLVRGRLPALMFAHGIYDMVALFWWAAYAAQHKHG